MLNSILAICRAVFLILGGHKQVALENIALRQQLGIFQRSVRRPKIRPLDRLFWVCLRKVWKEWKSALEFVQPETVVDWQGSGSNDTGPGCRGTRILVGLEPALTSENW